MEVDGGESYHYKDSDFFEPDIDNYELCIHFNSLVMTPPVVNYSDYSLKIQRRSNSIDGFTVIAMDDIPEGTYLGDIQGKRKYVWEVDPTEFTLFIDEDCVIDMNDEPRDICAYIREDFYDGLYPNCQLVRFCKDGHLHIGFRTLKKIMIGEELIYHQYQDAWIDID
jgi:hypothetical protein